MHGEIPESRTNIWKFPEMGVCVNTTKSWSNDLMTRMIWGIPVLRKSHIYGKIMN